MSGEDEFRMVSLNREQRDAIQRGRFGDATAATTPKLDDAMAHVVAAWDAAPESAWDEIADEFRRHRCKDGNCFAESVLMRLGAIRFKPSPWDLP